MRTFIRLLLACLPAATACAQDDMGFTLDDANRYRQQWTIANWDDGGELTRYVFLNMAEFWAHSLIDRGGPVRELGLAPRRAVADFVTRTEQGEFKLSDYVARTTVDGLVVLHAGKIVFEAYPRMSANDKHLYMSVSKPLASALVAIFEERGQIDVDKPVSTYLPELIGSGWDGVAVLDVLDMASGIDCRQTIAGVYDDPATCYYQFEAALGWLPPTDRTLGDPHAYVGSLAARRPAGEAFEYSSVNTFVLRWLLERLGGKPYADLVAREIWQRMGAESDALLVAPKNGVPIASSGVSSTLRDMARFGLLFTPSGRGGVNPVVSDAHLDRIQNGGRAEIFDAAREGGGRQIDGESPRHNSYQWDFVMQDGDFFKGGYGGQGLYISPSRDLVVAFFGTMNADGSGHELTRVARQLAKSGMFER